MEINNIVKLTDGRRGKILATPSGFLSNGAYEVEIDNKRFWLKEEDILYILDTTYEDDINKYFEVIFDESGIHLIPKNLVEITISDENDNLKSIEFTLGEGEKHKLVTFHIGGTNIWTTDKPKPEEEEKSDPKKHRIL